jgi:hypothetical protein
MRKCVDPQAANKRMQPDRFAREIVGILAPSDVARQEFQM